MLGCVKGQSLNGLEGGRFLVRLALIAFLALLATAVLGYSWTPAGHGFEADASGNLTTLRDQTQPYTPTNNELNKTGFAYDSNGNPTTYETHSVTWDPENRMTEYAGATTLTCGWRPDGMRAWKNSSSTTTYFYYDFRGVPVLEYRSGSIYAINTFGPNGLISRGTTSTNEIYYQFDERGNTISRSNHLGTVSGYHGSDTYGVQFASESSTDPFLGFGAQWGYYRDSENSFLLLGHRVYDPGYARFLNRDPIGYAGGINTYSYGLNSPTRFTDPSGLQSGGGMWYDRTASYWGHRIDEAKDDLNDGLSGVTGGWIIAGIGDTCMDLFGGLMREPAAIGHLGEGLGSYAGCQSEENAVKAWGDVGTGCSLALAGLTAGEVPEAEAPGGSRTPAVDGPRFGQTTPGSCSFLPKLSEPDFTVNGQRGLPYNGPPGSVGARFNDGLLKQLRIYGPDGAPLADIDWGHDHGYGDPHYHLWPNGVRDSGNSFP